MTITYRLPQQRRLVTELPGPRSQALDARRKKAVPAGRSRPHLSTQRKLTVG